MADELNTGWTAPLTEGDRLAEAGIFRHGYGLIPKYAMQDRELSITAKAIYAYLCSLCGGGETAFPGVGTIRAALGLGKDAYYQHRRQLEEAGYITVQRRHRGKTFTSNIYLLNANPKRLQGEPSGEWENRIFAAVRFRGLRGAGYGVLPRAVMTDPRLDAKAKALYAYFASFTGAGTCAFPTQGRMLRDLGVSQPAYYKYLNQLKRAGYLATVQRKDGTRFAVNEYYLLDGRPDAAEQRTETTARTSAAIQTGQEAELDGGSEAVTLPFAKNPDIMAPYLKNPDIINPVIMEPDTMEPDTTNNTFLTINKNYMNNKSSAIDRSAAPPSPGTPVRTGEGGMDGWRGEENRKTLEKYETGIKTDERAENFPCFVQNEPNSRKSQSQESKQNLKQEQDPKQERVLKQERALKQEQSPRQAEVLEELKRSFHYADLPLLYPGQDLSLIDNLLSLMAGALCGKDSLRIRGQRVSREEARARFLSLTAEHLFYVLRCVREHSGEIRNLRAYYLTALWNAPDTMELYQRRAADREAAQESSWSRNITDEEIAEYRREMLEWEREFKGETTDVI